MQDWCPPAPSKNGLFGRFQICRLSFRSLCLSFFQYISDILIQSIMKLTVGHSPKYNRGMGNGWVKAMQFYVATARSDWEKVFVLQIQLENCYWGKYCKSFIAIKQPCTDLQHCPQWPRDQHRKTPIVSRYTSALSRHSTPTHSEPRLSVSVKTADGC